MKAEDHATPEEDIASITEAAAAPQASRPAREANSSRNWKLLLAYDGGPFAGWQVQPGLTTVQGTLARAITRTVGEQVLPQGSGRTDTGVHALGQVASFALRANISASSLQRALNHRLPASIRVLGAEVAAPGFHARHSAQSKLYEYRIWRGELCPPWLAPYVYACPWPLDLDAMRHAATLVLGEHDFSSFAARQPDITARMTGQKIGVPAASGAQTAETPPGPRAAGVKHLLSSAWEQPEPDLLCYQVHGSGFLHHMVRNLVGTFLDVGRGQLDPSAIPGILAARTRSAAGSTAPARGLFLASVAY